MKSSFWQKHVYKYVVIGCGLFVLLTVIAMFTYPGGTFTDETTVGYDFFRNFFSDLGLVTAPNGQSNTISLILFSSALSMAGAGIVLFFIAFRDFFTSDRTGTLLGWLGTFIGVVSGLCFVGIALAPYDVVFDIHYHLVFWAFRTILITIALYAFIILRQNKYPRRYGWIFVAYTVFLAAYVGLLEFGPSVETPNGLIIQATGQKVIAYISIISVMVQSWLAHKIDQ